MDETKTNGQSRPAWRVVLWRLVRQIFGCNHPAFRLHTEREHTVEKSDKFPEDYEIVTYHLYCLKCDAKVPVTHVRCIGGVDGLMKRAEARHASLANKEFRDARRETPDVAR